MNRSHPLRRPSTGSLSSLARSTDRNTISPSGLDFLQPALSELNDEASTLATNISHLTELHDALGTFNESFAGYLYALKMNAFCVEWDQVSPDLPKFCAELTVRHPMNTRSQGWNSLVSLTISVKHKLIFRETASGHPASYTNGRSTSFTTIFDTTRPLIP